MPLVTAVVAPAVGAPARRGRRLLPLAVMARWGRALAFVALFALAAVDALTDLVLVSTLGVVVVVAGLLASPRTVAVLGAVALALAAVLAVVLEPAQGSPLSLANVAVGVGIALASATARAQRIRDVERLRRRDAVLLRSIGDAILGVDAAGCVTFTNLAAVRLLGLERGDGDVTGRPVDDVLAVRTAAGEDLRGAVRAAVAAEQPLDRTGALVVRPHGGTVPVDLVVQPLVEGEGAVLSLRDVSARERAARDRERLLRLELQDVEQRRVLRALEQALLPATPQVARTAFDVTYLPADVHAPSGGDLYDVHVLPDGRVHLLVVDVVGHDVASTRDALRIQHLIRALALTGTPVGRLVAEADRLLAAAGDPPMATVLAAAYDPASGALEVASGGHPPALLVSPDGATRWLEAEGRGIGFPMAGSDDVVRTVLVPGALLVLYTDGLVEAEHDIVAGLDRLAAQAARLRGDDRPGWTDRLAAAQLDDAQRRDDTLILAVRRLPG
jgi:PAS domain S-box-containing protein